MLEFSRPRAFPIKQFYRFYSRVILPRVGSAISQDEGAYRYLPESVAAFPDGEDFLERLRKAGSLSESNYAALSEGYRLLAAVDHALRLTIGRTTRLPLARPDTITLVAARTGHADSPSLLAGLTDRRLAVREAFESVVAVDQGI